MTSIDDLNLTLSTTPPNQAGSYAGPFQQCLSKRGAFSNGTYSYAKRRESSPYGVNCPLSCLVLLLLAGQLSLQVSLHPLGLLYVPLLVHHHELQRFAQ
jgi:hypothetical protein